MHKAVFYLLLIFIGLAPSIPAVAHADTKSAQHSSVKSNKAYLKHQKKQLKNAQKQQKQSLKKWKKLHNVSP